MQADPQNVNINFRNVNVRNTPHYQAYGCDVKLSTFYRRLQIFYKILTIVEIIMYV